MVMQGIILKIKEYKLLLINKRFKRPDEVEPPCEGCVGYVQCAQIQ